MEPSSLLGGGAGAEEEVAQDCDKGSNSKWGTATEGLVKTVTSYWVFLCAFPTPSCTHAHARTHMHAPK